MACSKAEDLINQLIEATLKLLDFGLNIMDALRVQKLLTIRNQKIGLISDDACLPECSLRFSLNFDLMMFNKLLSNACLRARATLNELRVCRLRYPNAPLVLEPKTKAKFYKLQKKIQEFDEAVRSDKMIARRDLRDFREISIIFSQLEHDLKLLICSLECASTMKDTILFAAPITDVMTVLSIVLNRLERLAQKAEIDEKIAPVDQQKILQNQKIQSNSATPIRQQPSTSPITKNRNNHFLFNGKNTNRTPQQRQQDMTAIIAAASQQNKILNYAKKPEKIFIQNDSSQTIRSDKCLKENYSIDINEQKSKLPRHINRHYNSIKSNISQHQKKIVTPFENIPDRIPSNHHHIKQLHHEFIRKWTDDARNIYTQNHIIHSSNTNSDIDLKEKDRHHTTSISSLLNNNDTSSSSSNSTSLSSIIENQSNNSAIVYLKSKKSNDNLEYVKKTIVNTTTSLLLHIHVRPNAKINAIREINSNNEIRIDIAADAQDGKANYELIDYIKTILKIPSNQLEIIQGHKQHDKIIRISTTIDKQNDLFQYLKDEIT